MRKPRKKSRKSAGNSAKKASKKALKKALKKAVKKTIKRRSAARAGRRPSSKARKKAVKRSARRPASKKAARSVKQKVAGRARTGPRIKTLHRAPAQAPLSAGLIQRNVILTAIGDLNLAEHARRGAELLLAAHPAVVFTSGRRTVAEQASAMAGNVVQNRRYIVQTYTAVPERDQLQGWVDAHPEATTRQQIAAGLLKVMNGWSEDSQRRISAHIGGLAFDVQPVGGAAGDAIKQTIRGLPNLRGFLEHEAGLVRWHAAFERG